MTGIQALMEEYCRHVTYCQFIWQTDCICQLQLLAANTAYLIRFWGRRKLFTVCGKFDTVSRGIWQTVHRCLEKFAAENCGPQ